MVHPKRHESQRTTTRRKGRECAVQILYALESVSRPSTQGSTELPTLTESLVQWTPHEIKEQMDHFFASFDIPPALHVHATSLVLGVMEHIERIDLLLAQHSPHWRLERMGRVDRNILRNATYELLFTPELDTPIIMNEAIEIAHRFGSEHSFAFINGILDMIAKTRNA